MSQFTARRYLQRSGVRRQDGRMTIRVKDRVTDPSEWRESFMLNMLQS